MKEFFKKLFSSDGEISSKRVIGFAAFVLIAESINAAMWLGKSTPDFMFNGLIILVGTCFGLNAAIDIFKKKDDGKV